MYKVNGFLFETEAQAELAKKEEEAVRYIKERTALDNPGMVLQLYHKLLAEELFVTAVGQRFLIELQNLLYAADGISEEEILPIKAAVPEKTEAAKVEEKTAKKANKKMTGNYKKPFYIAAFFAIVFGISIIGIFIITEISGNNVNIINYRNEILNEYSEWENELKEKENELRDWEAQLQQKEAGISNETLE